MSAHPFSDVTMNIMVQVNATAREKAAQLQLMREGTIPLEYVKEQLSGSFSSADRPFAALVGPAAPTGEAAAPTPAPKQECKP
jgi:hypothetical protein